MIRNKERLHEILAGIILAVILYLFYHSYFVFTLLLPCMAVYRKYHRKAIQRAEKETLNMQFGDMLDSLSASLRAGYSMENALAACKEELSVMHGEDSPICRELGRMENQIRVGIATEEVFLDFAERTRVEDIETFASVFCIARQTGGNLVEIVGRTAEDLSGKLDTRKEIEVLISAKKLEQRIMTGVPILILLYVDLTSDGLLDPLYGNITGIVIMTGCLLVYLAAIWLGERIMRIEV